MTKKEYGNESIRSLTDRQAVRMRVSTYAGGSDKEGAFTTVREVVSNSIDEFKASHGNNIKVEFFKDNSVKVSDCGRGCPVDWNEGEQKYNYELIFLSLNAGGKYSQDSYEYSLGLNGIGTALSILSSEFAEVEVVRDGYQYNLSFEKGEFVGELRKVKTSSKETGTSIHWKPDLDVFTEIDFPREWFVDYLEQQAIVNKGLHISFVEEDMEQQDFFYENGIVDYVKAYNQGKEITEVVYLETETTGKDREDKPAYKSKYQIAFSFNNNHTLMESYHNSSFLKHGGSPHDAIKSAFVSAIDKQLKAKSLYTKTEKKISFEDVRDSMVIVTNTYSTETSYQNQTKFAITNKFIKDFMTEYLKEQLEIYFIENSKEAELILKSVLVNKRSREKSEETRLNIKKKLSGTVNNLTSPMDGFINCKSKDNSKTEFYVVEGKSALGSTKQGRDEQIQAIYALRGKTLNCLKADYDRIFKNDVIVDLIRVLGCGIEVNSKHAKDLHTFDLEKLRWSKVIIATDADVDGFHIRTLILTMIKRLMPTLIDKGLVFIAESPLYEISQNDVSQFAYSDKEKDDIVSKLKGSYLVQRSKGLGENTAEMMWDTTMNPETRKLIQITPSGVDETLEYFEMFLGDNLEGRKEYIEENLHKYLNDPLD